MSTLIGTTKILISITKMKVMMTLFVANFLNLVMRIVGEGGRGDDCNENYSSKSLVSTSH